MTKNINSICLRRSISKCHCIPINVNRKCVYFEVVIPSFCFHKKVISAGAWSSMGLQKWTNSICLKSKKNHAPLPNEAWKLHSTDRATACHLKMKLKRAGVLTRSPCNQFWVWTLNKAQWMRIITIRIDTIQLHLYPSNCDDLVPIPNIIWIMIKCHAPSLNLVHLTQEFWLIIVMWLMDKANKNYA